MFFHFLMNITNCINVIKTKFVNLFKGIRFEVKVLTFKVLKVYKN